MPSSLQPFLWGSAVWAVALAAVLLGLEPFGMDRVIALGTCVTALVFGTLGFAYMWPRNKAAADDQE